MSLAYQKLGAVLVLCLLGFLVPQAQGIHSDPACGSGYTTAGFNFSSTPFASDEYTWTAGSLSQSFANVDGSGTAVTVTISGATATLGTDPGTGQLSPNTSAFFGTYGEVLGMYSTGIGNGNNSIDIQLDISPAIPGELAFELFHINQSGSGDNIKVSALTHLGTTIYPTFSGTSSPDWVATGPGTIDARTFTDLANAQAGVNFSSPDSIQQITIEWQDCNGCPVSAHGMGLGDFQFCRKVRDNDMDGIEDLIDIDDDNDGITDSYELCQLPTIDPDKDTLGVVITLDGYPDETSWEITDRRGNVVASGGPYTAADIGLVKSIDYIHPANQDYRFTIKDSYGDALTSAPTGSYELRRNGTAIVGPIAIDWGFSNSHIILGAGTYDPFSCVGGDPADDADGDGILNYLDPSFCSLNGNNVCSAMDTDQDGVIDAFDLDADNDGIGDLVEAGGVDTDGNGLIDGTVDVDQNGLIDLYDDQQGGNAILNLDSDGDGISNAQDLDSDNDGLPDVVESGGTDSDADGIADNWTDADGDGFNDLLDGDADNDGISENSAQALVLTGADGNGDGVPDSFPDDDTDGDGIPDALDLDSDNDGILDVIEAGGTDANNDGKQDGTDSDGDGYSDSVDGDVGNDGVAESTANGLAATGSDGNGDGKPDSYPNGDFDGDGIINSQDPDADNDGILDVIEAQGNACYSPAASTVNSEGVPINFVSYANCDDAGSGLSYGVTPNADADDGDGSPDFLDLDTDGDGASDFSEGFDTDGDGQAIDQLIALANAFTASGGSTAAYATYNGQDTDGDLIPDWLDNMPLAIGYSELSLPPFLDPTSTFYYDTDRDGIVDLFDTDHGGSLPPFPPDSDSDNDPDWRDLDSQSPLPVEFGAFTAQLVEGKDGLLKWSTLKEVNNDHFIVFRSMDGIQYEQIGTVAGLGNTNALSNYQFTDPELHLLGSERFYYRLLQVDRNGLSTPSEVRILNMEADAIEFDLELWPNPCQEHLNVLVTGLEQEAHWTLISIQGQILREGVLAPSPHTEVQLDFSSLASGTYLLRVRMGEAIHIKKIHHR